MFAKLTQSFKKRIFGTTTLAVVAVFFLFGGLITASGLNLTDRSRAEALFHSAEEAFSSSMRSRYLCLYWLI